MPVTLESLAAHRSQLKVSVWDQTITLEYKPGLITHEAVTATAPLGENGQIDGAAAEIAVNKLLASAIVSWDLAEKVGKTNRKLPITEASMRKLPAAVKNSIFTGMIRDANSVGELESSSADG